MLTLGIDTTGKHCSAAVLRDGKVTASRRENAERRQVERLMYVLDEVLANAQVGYGELDRIGVSIGPGSFTGIRIGLAAANGIALGSAAKVIGVGTLHAMAHEAIHREISAPDALIIPVIDARKGALYVQAFDAKLTACAPPAAVGVNDTLDWLSSFAKGRSIRICGSGSDLLAKSLQGTDLQLSEDAPADSELGVDPVSVARLADEEQIEEGIAKAEPLYIRPPDAKLPGKP